MLLIYKEKLAPPKTVKKRLTLDMKNIAAIRFPISEFPMGP